MTTFITGGTGKTGRRVAQRLTATGRSVKLGSRSGDVRFDWDDELTWAPALDGCRSAYVTFAPDLAFPGAADTVAAFAKTALDAGTTRLVLLSGRGEPGAQLAEQRLIESGADWTVVRCAFFAQNSARPSGPSRSGPESCRCRATPSSRSSTSRTSPTSPPRP